MSGKFRTTWFCANVLHYTETEGGRFSKKEVEYHDPKSVDLDEFAQCLADAYEEMDAAGYEVINVVPIATGTSAPSLGSRGEYLGDTGYSPTRAAVIVGKKKDF